MKNVFVLIDGTGCHSGTGTNIFKMWRLAENAGYPKLYRSGPGAISNTGIRDQYFAPNVEPMAVEIYQSLVDLSLSYQDRLYIIGYSRGAIIARTLALCIASTHNLQKAAKKSAVYGSIPAQIELLCLFDPVIGKPRMSRNYVNNHEAILNQRVKTYVELLSLDEPRPHFSSDSYFASKNVRKSLSRETSSGEAKTSQDRKDVLQILNLRKTRRSIWFPGNHSDIGGHGENELIGAHTLATALEELLLASAESDAPLTFAKVDVEDLITKISCSLEPKPIKKPKTAFLQKFIKKLGNRKPDSASIIQHLAHSTCSQSEDAAADTEKLAKYPSYTKIREFH